MTAVCATRFAAVLASRSNQFCDKLLDPKGPLGRQEFLKTLLAPFVSAAGAALVPSPDTSFRKLVGVAVALGATETSAHFLGQDDEDVQSVRALAKQYLKEGRALEKASLDQIRKMHHQLKDFILFLSSSQLEALSLVLEDVTFSDCPEEEALLKKLYASLVMNEKQRDLLDAASRIFSAKEQEVRQLVILSKFFSVEEKRQWDAFDRALQLTVEQKKILGDFRKTLNEGNNKDVIYLLAESYLQSEMCSKAKSFLDQKENAQMTIFFAVPLYSLFGIFKNFHVLFNIFHWGSLFAAIAATAHIAYQHLFSNIPAEIRSDALQLQELNKIEISPIVP